jgi:hypothetical protein
MSMFTRRAIESAPADDRGQGKQGYLPKSDNSKKR